MGTAIANLLSRQTGVADDDAEFIIELSSQVVGDEMVALATGKLDWSPKSNWVEDNGGLPPGIESMAIHMMKASGLTREHAIAASVTRAKVLAAKGKARWVKEVAKWEALKAKAAAKRAAKKASSD